jgi:transcriptional regulator with XRE-family HTH domain
MKKTTVKGTVERELAAMTPQERKAFDEEYQELLLSEAIIAVMQKDDISVRKLAAKAQLSPTTVQDLRSGVSNAGVRSFFKIFKSLGYTIFAEKNEERIPITIPSPVESAGHEEVTTSHSSLPRFARNK